METPPPCPECSSELTYEDESQFVCPECAHSWAITSDENDSDAASAVLDANGNPLAHGDTVILVKSLKVRGAQSDLKVGTKVKNVRLVSGDHNLDCKIDGFGAMKLKSAFVKKA
ncbi:MAG: zinc ribbon domain-containing protein YjdM [Algisphaera sp.]